jgi:hypothetical protein
VRKGMSVADETILSSLRHYMSLIEEEKYVILPPF